MHHSVIMWNSPSKILPISILLAMLHVLNKRNKVEYGLDWPTWFRLVASIFYSIIYYVVFVHICVSLQIIKILITSRKSYIETQNFVLLDYVITVKQVNDGY